MKHSMTAHAADISRFVSTTVDVQSDAYSEQVNHLSYPVVGEISQSNQTDGSNEIWQALPRMLNPTLRRCIVFSPTGAGSEIYFPTEDNGSLRMSEQHWKAFLSVQRHPFFESFLRVSITELFPEYTDFEYWLVSV